MNKSRERIVLIILLLLTALIAYQLLVKHHPYSDYISHIIISERIEFNWSLSPPVPHFLYHVLISLVDAFFPLTREHASILVLTLTSILTTYVLWQYARKEAPYAAPETTGFVVFFTLVLVPASILRFHIQDPNFYYAYFHPAPYHNPTFIAAKPFVLMLSLSSITVFAKKELSIHQQAFLIFALATSTLMKPNYLIAFLPAVILFAAWHLVLKRDMDRFSLIFTLIIPSMLLLLWQFLYTYDFHEADTTSVIIFAPFAVINHFANAAHLDSSSDIFFNLLLSTMYPISFILLYSQARREKLIHISWLTFGISVLQGVLLAESGDRFLNGNFLWGGHFSLFVIYAVTSVTALKLKVHKHQGWRLIVFAIVIVLHLLSGLLWLFFNSTFPDPRARWFW